MWASSLYISPSSLIFLMQESPFQFSMAGEEISVPKLPVGFRFLPTDEELVTYYLINRVYYRPLPAKPIQDIHASEFYGSPPHHLGTLIYEHDMHIKSKSCQLLFLGKLVVQRSIKVRKEGSNLGFLQKWLNVVKVRPTHTNHVFQCCSFPWRYNKWDGKKVYWMFGLTAFQLLYLIHNSNLIKQRKGVFFLHSRRWSRRGNSNGWRWKRVLEIEWRWDSDLWFRWEHLCLQDLLDVFLRIASETQENTLENGRISTSPSLLHGPWFQGGWRK